MTIEKTLENIGLNAKERKVYLELLRHTSIKPAALARRVNLSRPTVYDVLRSLQNKGLIYATVGKSTQTFVAKDPRVITQMIDRDALEYVQHAEEKKLSFEHSLPDLLALAKEASTVPRIKYFEGSKGIEEALQETLTTKDIIRAYADIESITQAMGDRFTKYLAQRVQKGIHARAIAPDTEEWRARALKGKEELRNVRFLSPGSEYSPEINIFDNCVLMISWKESFAVIVTSKDFAHAQRVIFDELWDRLSRE